MAVISDIEIRLRADIARLQQDMNGARRAVDSATNRITQAANQARAALAGIAAGIGLSELARLTDGYTKFTAQLKLATSSQQEYARAVEDVKRISNTAQNDIGATGVLYARIIASTKTLGVTQSQVAKVTETVNLALAATAASASESSSAMLQLSQAFGSGVLRGEEFNAVNEAAPELLRVLAASIGVPFGQLRKLAEQGKLTSDILVKAFSDDAVIARLRDNVSEITTISGALQVFKNNLMEVVGQQAHASGAVAGLTKAILAAAGAIGGLNAVLAPALKIGAAYVAAFVIAPPLFAATATAMGNLRLQIALAKLEMASGATAASLFSRALGGVSVSAQLAAGSLTKMGLATNVAFAAFVGWEIGKYLNDQFVEAAIAGEIMADLLLKSWEYVKFGFKTGFDALTLLTRNTIAKLAELAGGWFEIVAKGMRAIGDDTKADALVAYADKIRAATAVSGTFASRTAEARSEMDKNIRVIEADTDRRIAAAYAASRQGVKLTEAAQAAVAGGKATTALTEEQKKALAVYEDLIRTLQARVDETAREAAGLAALTTAEKAHLDLTEQIRTGKLKLTKAQEDAARSLINEAGANDVLIRGNKEYADLQQQLVDNAKDLAAERLSLIESARQEAEQNERLVQTFGMSEAAITRMQAARLLEQEAQRLGRDLTAEEIEDLQRVIELKERSANAVASRAELEKTKQFWSDIDDTARATFTSIADGGKSAFQRLKDTAKNTFFDWLYQQTLRKWIINIGTSVTGTALSAGVASAAGGAAAAGISGSIGSAAGIAGLLGSVGGIGAGALQTAGALIGGHIGLGTTINAGIAALTSGTAAGVSAGLASLAGTLGPIALGIGAAVKAFGRGPKEYANSGVINGAFGENGLSATLNRDWVKKGGWLRSDKKGTDSQALDAATASGLNAAYDALKAGAVDYAKVLGVNADSIAGRTQDIRIALGKDEAATQKAIEDFFGKVANTIAEELIPTIGSFAKLGETSSSTLERITANYAAVDAALSSIGASFGAVGVDSIDARNRLVEASGGIDKFAANVGGFQQNFLSETERVAPVLKNVTEKLKELGLSSVTSNEQFKDAVLGLINTGAIATEAGAKTYAELMSIQAQASVAFGSYSDAVDISNQKRNVEIEILKLQGNATEALRLERESELKTAKDSIKTSLERLYAVQDEQAALSVSNAKRSQEAEILDLLGDKTGALAIRRALELASIGDALREQQQRIYSLEDEAEALQANNALRSQEAAILELTGDKTGALAIRRELEIAGMDKALQAGQRRIYALEDEAVKLETASSLLEIQAQIYELTGDKAGVAAVLASQQANALIALDPALRGATQQLWALQAAAKEADKIKANADSLVSGVDSAFSVLQKIVQNEKKFVQEEIDLRAKAVKKSEELSKALRSAIDDMGVSTPKLENREAARAQIQAALAIKKAGGALPTAADLKGALTVLSKDPEDLFSNRSDYLRDLAASISSIEELAKVADETLTSDELAVKRLEDQVKQYDRMLEKEQEQIDLLKGVNSVGLSIQQAVTALNTAVLVAQNNQVNAATVAINNAYKELLGRTPDPEGLKYWQDRAAAGTAIETIVSGIKESSEAQIQKLYRTVLGREGEAAGIAFWKKAFGDSVDSSEYAQFVKGARPEMEMKQPPNVYSAPQSGTMTVSQGNSTEMAEMKRDAARTAAAVEQLAREFNKVSGGGNSLLMEQA